MKRQRRSGEKTGNVDWQKVKATTADDITRQIAEDPDTAPDVSMWDLSKARLVRPARPLEPAE